MGSHKKKKLTRRQVRQQLERLGTRAARCAEKDYANGVVDQAMVCDARAAAYYEAADLVRGTKQREWEAT